MTDDRAMTKGEREELKRLARERARVAKHDVARRSADLKADFEHQVATEYDWNRDEVWKAAVENAAEAVEVAQDAIAERCEEMGIPRELAPRLGFEWHGRGPGVVRHREGQLRRAANARIDAMARTAVQEIDRKALEIQTQLVRAGLTSGSAISFLETMPKVEELMPSVDLGQFELPPGDDHRHDAW